MKIGDRVMVTAPWSSLREREGVVVELLSTEPPAAMVRIDGLHPQPIRHDVASLLVVNPEPHWTAGE